MNDSAIKGLEGSKTFLAEMAHMIQELQTDSTDGRGVDSLGKQILLEDIGYAWI